MAETAPTPVRLADRDALRRVGRTGRDALTTGHVVAVYVVVECAIRWVRTPTLARLLGCRLDLSTSEPVEGAKPTLGGHAIRQLRCIRRVASRWPFGSGPCLRTALVSGHLLRRLDPVIRLGSIGAGDALSAHAWLEIDGYPLEPVRWYRPFETRPEGR